jgi:hypothetical protein
MYHDYVEDAPIDLTEFYTLYCKFIDRSIYEDTLRQEEKKKEIERENVDGQSRTIG